MKRCHLVLLRSTIQALLIRSYRNRRSLTHFPSQPLMRTLPSAHRQKKEVFSACWTGWQRNVVLNDKTARSTECITDTEPSDHWRRGEGRLYSVLSCSYIPDHQRQNRVFRGDDTFTKFAVNNQTRHEGFSQDTTCAETHATPYEKVRGQKYRKYPAIV